VLKKARDRAREEIREKISPPLDLAAVSEVVVRVFWWWARTWWSRSSSSGCAQQWAGPLSFYTLQVPIS